MTCLVQVTAADGRTTPARALLDSASSTSFMSEHLAQLLRLPRTRKTAHIAGIGGLSNNSLHQSVVHFSISPLQLPTRRMNMEAVVLPKVTLNIPTSHVPLRSEWDRLSGLDLADPHFGSPGAVDLLLGVDVFTAVLGHGRRSGPQGSPTAVETSFGLVLAGTAQCNASLIQEVSHHVSTLSGDDILRKFWEVEEFANPRSLLTSEEQMVVTHFQDTPS